MTDIELKEKLLKDGIYLKIGCSSADSESTHFKVTNVYIASNVQGYFITIQDFYKSTTPNDLEIGLFISPKHKQNIFNSIAITA